MEGFSEDDTVVIVDVSTEPVLFSSMPTELLIAPGKHHESHSFTTTASGFPSPFTSATATAADHGNIAGQSEREDCVRRFPGSASVAIDDPRAIAKNTDVVGAASAPVRNHRLIAWKPEFQIDGRVRIVSELAVKIQHPGALSRAGWGAPENTELLAANSTPVTDDGDVAGEAKVVSAVVHVPGPIPENAVVPPQHDWLIVGQSQKRDAIGVLICEGLVHIHDPFRVRSGAENRQFGPG